MQQEVAVVADDAALAQEGATRVAAIVRDAVRVRGVCTLVLAGGHTPPAMYRALAARPNVSWTHVQVFWGDERAVPPDDPLSNYRMARESLLSAISAPLSQVHRIRGEDPIEAAAAAYEALVRGYFGGPPQWDLVLLGMGEDGHVASLFPGHAALTEARRLVVPVTGERINPSRITLTLPALNAAETVLLVVSGSRKAEIVRIALASRSGSLPVQQIRPRGRLLWMLDRAAAAKLPASRDRINTETREDV